MPAVMHVQWQIRSALLEDTVITHGYFAGSPSQHYLAPFKLDPAQVIATTHAKAQWVLQPC